MEQEKSKKWREKMSNFSRLCLRLVKAVELLLLGKVHTNCSSKSRDCHLCIMRAPETHAQKQTEQSDRRIIVEIISVITLLTDCDINAL